MLGPVQNRPQDGHSVGWITFFRPTVYFNQLTCRYYGLIFIVTPLVASLCTDVDKHNQLGAGWSSIHEFRLLYFQCKDKEVYVSNMISILCCVFLGSKLKYSSHFNQLFYIVGYTYLIFTFASKIAKPALLLLE